ncbi:MAG: hypothetical protein C7B46_09690 [Sulfobacillus benefaciens]|uniref:ABC transporter domain-containing protein n=1 Tax=Sulfobacillus benefaciens TaxID=453960 RepID=A0A2T2XGD5_9FIRM|nr:MAG: hypothetical protein C7B46_09690 [Sulfobacillus benefaciens]
MGYGFDWRQGQALWDDYWKRAIQVFELRDVSRTYHIGGQEISALSHINLVFPDHSFSIVLGPSGSGKSTLLNLLGGLDRPTSGEVLFNGLDLSQFTNDQLASFRRHYVGTVFQAYHLLPHLTALENVELALSMDSPSGRRQRAEQLLTQVGLGSRLHNRPAELSGGEQQRVAVARALAHDPSILLADEPTGNLDAKARRDIMDLLHHLHEQGYTVIIITHNEELVTSGDRVIRLHDGMLMADSVPMVLDQSPATPVAVERVKTRMGWSWWMAWRNLRRSKSRTLLTAIGTAIGIGSIVLTVAFGTGLQQNANQSLAQNGGLNTVEVVGQMPPGASAVNFAEPKPLNLSDISYFQKLPGVSSAYGMISAPVMVKTLATVPAVIDNLPLTGLPTGQKLVAGRVPKSGNAVLLSQNGVKPLFGSEPLAHLIGQKITVMPTSNAPSVVLTVAGVISASSPRNQNTSPGVAAASGSANNLYVPYPTAVTYWAGHPPAFSQAIIIANNASATVALTKTLSQKGFVVFSLREIAKGIDTFVIIIQTVLGAFGGIALVVAGIMIALVMMWAVLERTREIGILKALGARAQDIRRVFVDEAALIGLLAGIIGLVGAYLTAFVLQAVLKMLIEKAGGTAPVSLFVVPWWLVVSALAFGMVVGTVGSWIPAFRASRLSVVHALRHDG